MQWALQLGRARQLWELARSAQQAQVHVAVALVLIASVRLMLELGVRV